MNRKPMKKILFTVTVVVLLIVFGVSAFMVGSYVINSKRTSDRYDQLAEIAHGTTQSTTQPTQPPATTGATTATTQPTEETEPPEPTMSDRMQRMQELYNQNNDLVGWIKIEGTKVDYPVMQTPNDRDYYLYRDFDKRKNQEGSIYAWAEADINKPSDNITLFGHHMASGSMFAALQNYEHKSAWEDNSVIFFDTLTEEHTYKIFAVFKTSANVGQGFSYHQFVDAANEQEFNDFVSTCKSLSFYDTGVTPVYGDKLICLSTCEYTLDNGRLVVAAVRMT